MNERFGLLEIFLFSLHLLDRHVWPGKSLVLSTQSHHGIVACSLTELLKARDLALLPIGPLKPSGVQLQLINASFKSIEALELLYAAGQGEPGANMDRKTKSNVVGCLAGGRVGYT